MFLIFLLLWIVFFSVIRTFQHFSFGTNACDLSIFDYALHSTINGDFMADPFHKYSFGELYSRQGEVIIELASANAWDSLFSIHSFVVLLFIVPFYLIFSSPLLLLYLQVLSVGLAAIPLYLIAKSVFTEKYVPFIIAAIFLFFRHLLIGLMYDFHPEMFLPLFIFSGYYFIAVKRKPALYMLFLSLALFVKEDIAIYTVFFGIFLLFKLKEKKYGLVTTSYSLIYLFITIEVIMPYFRSLDGVKGQYEFFSRWSHLGDNSLAIFWSMLTHPGSMFQDVPIGTVLTKFSNMLSPLLILPLISSYGLLIFPPLFIAILSRAPQMYTFGIHYSAAFLPFIFLGLVYGLKNLRGLLQKQRFISAKKVFFAILLILLFINLSNSNFWRIIKPSRYAALKDYKKIERVINMVPREASVAALSSIIPHMPKRKDIFMLPDTGDADYIFVHAGINLWPYTKDEYNIFLDKLDKDPNYMCVEDQDGLRLYRKNKLE